MTNKIIFVYCFILFGLTFNSMKAFDCWDGYDQKVVTIEVNGCLYDVEVCYKCAATAMESAVQIVSIIE